MLENGEFYSAVVVSSEWGESNGKVFLTVACDVNSGNGVERCSGRIYATGATAAKKLEKDGSESSSMLERMLGAVGFDIDSAHIVAETLRTGGSVSSLVGTSQPIAGHACRVKIEDNEYKGKTYQRIGGFYAGSRKVDFDALSDLLGSAKPEKPKRQRAKPTDAPEFDSFATSDDEESDEIPF